MKPEVRKRLRQYGIPIDLVILATGVGLLFTGIPALTLLFIFLTAVGLSAWKLGWKSGLVAMLAGLLAMVFGFPDTMLGAHAVTFAGLSLIVTGMANAVRPQRPVAVQERDVSYETPARVYETPALVDREEERDVSYETPALVDREEVRLIPEDQLKEVLVYEARAEERPEVERVEREEPVHESPRPDIERVTPDVERETPEAEPQRPDVERTAVAPRRSKRSRPRGERAAEQQKERERLEREAEARRIALESAAAERAEQERIAAEREAEERLAAERQERERIEREKEELALKLEEERLALERAMAERAEQERIAAERAAEERLAAERQERERIEREKEELARKLEEERLALERAAAERAEQERVEAERVAAQLAAEREERERIAREREELISKLEEERLALERAAAERAEQERVAAERAAEERLAAERRERERVEREKEELARKLEEGRLALERAAAERAEQERLETERAAARLAAEREERERFEREKEALEQRLASGGEGASVQLAAEREARERLEREKQELAQQLEQAREASQRTVEERLASERAELQRKFDEQLRTERDAMEQLTKTNPGTAPPDTPEEPRTGIFSTLTSWIKSPKQSRTAVNLKTKKVASNAPPRRSILPPPPQRRAATAAPATQRDRRPRILMLERRRGMADTVAPRLRELGVDVQIVERWIDAVDELFRFRPDGIFVDVDLADFSKVYKSISEQAPKLPIFLTSASHSGLPMNIGRAGSIIRPYNPEGIARIARDVVTNPQNFLERQVRPAGHPQPASSEPASPPPRRAPIAAAEPLVQGPIPLVPTPASEADERYDVVCFNCRVAFDATDADWCSCLTKERTLVCTNCLTCFCKAPPAYKEKFWVEAPPRLFERKTAELRKQQISVGANPAVEEVKRPMVLLVEDDEDIQTIVQRVCSNLGYGFVTANNGQDGLTLARLYRPNLILSDAFMPKLDGREMCRILKEEAIIPDCKMIVMTGLYTDTKYKSEALKRFHIDDYLSKPVSITDLINLLQKHLEGVASGTPQEDLFALHRQQMEDEVAEDAPEPIDEPDDDRTIPLSELLEQQDAQSQLRVMPSEPRSNATNYEICCYTCGELFDATKAEWCTCLGRDQSLVCPNCNNCFCKSPAAYKERFWIDAPSTLFERKMIGSKRNVSGKANPSPMEVKRPLILLVEDDENIQLIVKTVVTTMGYGFIVAANGQEGLALAREYNPDLILSDAFMPKLDGREMCRLLKEDPATSRVKAIIMTGLYTDRKYRNEALSYFKVDDYVAKPVAVDDLIKLMKKHLPQDVQPTM